MQFKYFLAMSECGLLVVEFSRADFPHDAWLQAFYFRNLSPLMLLPEWNFVWLFMVFIGGLAHVRGVIAGAVLLTIAPEFLGFATEQTILATSGHPHLEVVGRNPRQDVMH